MNFNLKRPCANCPFRVDGAIDLKPGRIEGIARNLTADDRQWFMCHKTLEQGDRSQCVGSMVYLLKVDCPNVSMRLAAALGMLRFDDLRVQYADIINPIDEDIT